MLWKTVTASITAGQEFRTRKNSLGLKPNTEGSPVQNKLSCYRDENSCKSIFHSHSEFQFSNVHKQLSVDLLISPLRDPISSEKEMKSSSSPVPENRCLSCDSTSIDSALIRHLLCAKHWAKIGSTNINVSGAVKWALVIVGNPSAHPVHFMPYQLNLPNSKEESLGRPFPALSPYNFVCLANI